MAEARADVTSQEQTPVVFVIDDDADMRASLSGLLRSAGLCVETFDAADQLLPARWTDRPGCILLDLRLRGTSGLAVQQRLLRFGEIPPVVFISAYGDVPTTVKAMKAGAVDFLSKPFREQDLLDAVNAALERDHARVELSRTMRVLRARWSTLTPRESQVMGYVARGMTNKQIADLMTLSDVTVKIHRSQGMKKMAARTLARFLQQAVALDLCDKEVL